MGTTKLDETNLWYSAGIGSACFLHSSLLSGKIACANVLSDLFAMGVTDCDNMLMLLGVSTKMTEKERDVVIPLMMRGFKVSYGSVRSCVR